MREFIKDFPAQLKDALKVSPEMKISEPENDIFNIVIAGLGGSGIGGTIVSQLIANQIDIPVVVNKTYGIPNLVNKHTLFVASSYSGNTEETLEALEKAQSKGATIACLTR